MRDDLHKAVYDLRLLAEHSVDGFVRCCTPKGWKAPRGFPRGELLCVNSKGESVRLYRSDRLLAWCDRTTKGET